MADYIIHTDGGSRGNPGQAAIGVIIKSANGELKKAYGESIGIATNNDAEYQAVVFSLKKLKSLIGKEKSKNAHVEVYMDSELLERQLNGYFKVVDERMGKYFLQVWNSKMDFKKVTFHHIYREKNKEADSMVNSALDKETNKLL